MILVAVFFAVVISGGSAYEVWAVWMEHHDRKVKYTITAFVAAHPHAAILLGLALFTLFGYALGRGGS